MSKIAAALCLFLLTFPHIYSQTLSVEPKEGMADEALEIRVKGLIEGQPVILRATMKDVNGNLWRSFAGFWTGRNNEIDLSRDAPANGDYKGVNPNGLVQFMDLPVNKRGVTKFSYDYNDYTQTFEIDFYLEVEGKVVDSAKVLRRKISPTTEAIEIKEQGLAGILFAPKGKEKKPAIIVLGGSEGGISAADDASLLSSKGFVSFALAYFRSEGLPDSLEEIPLEYFKKAVDFIGSKDYVDETKIGIMGASKGAEAALLVASLYKNVKAVVVYSPSSVVWGCLCSNPAHSSWTVKGQGLEFMPAITDPTYAPQRNLNYPYSAAVNYRYRLKNNQDAAIKSAIPVEKIKGPVLLISGKDDKIWPSSEMGEMILERLKKNEFKYEYKHLAYDGAGHSFIKAILPLARTNATAGGRFLLGGSVEANAFARNDSWPKVIEFFKNALSK